MVWRRYAITQRMHQTNFIMITTFYEHNHFTCKNYEAYTACFNFMSTRNRSINKESPCTFASSIRKHQRKTQECRPDILNIYLRLIWPVINKAQLLHISSRGSWFLVQSHTGYCGFHVQSQPRQRDMPGSITTATLGVLADHGSTQPLHEKAETVPQRRHRFQ